MNSPRLRAFVIALCGLAVGIALSKFSGGSSVAIIAVAAGLLCFVMLRMRGRR